MLLLLFMIVQTVQANSCPGQMNHFASSKLGGNRFTTIYDGNYTIKTLVTFSRGIDDKCDSISQSGLRNIYAIKYAIDKLNNGTFSKYGKLGLQLDDVCRSLPVTMARGIEIVSLHRENSVCRSDFMCEANNKKKTAAVVGTAMSFTSIPLASLMSLYDIPQISHTASSRLLSKTELYKSFFRTIPSDKQQVAAMLDIVKKFNWNYIIAIGSDDDYGKLGISDLKREAQKMNICIALDEYIPFEAQLTDEKVEEVVNKIKEQKKAQVVVLFCYVRNLGDRILKAANRKGVQKIWLTSEAWNPSATNLSLDIRNQTEGLLTVSMKAFELNYLVKYLHDEITTNFKCNMWLQNYLEANDKCKISSIEASKENFICENGDKVNINGLVEKLSQNIPASTYNLVNAVQAIGLAIYNVLEKKCEGLMSCYVPEIEPHSVTNELRNVSFINDLGYTISFDSQGDPKTAFYSIENIRVNETIGRYMYQPVGNWTQGKGLELDVSKIVWPKWWSDLKLKENSFPHSRCANDCIPGEYYIGNLKDCCWECQQCTGNTISPTYMARNCTDCGNYSHTLNNVECVKTPIHWMKIDDPAGMTIVIISALSFLFMIAITAVLMKLRHLISDEEIPPNMTGITCFLPIITFVYGPLHIVEPTDIFCQIRNAYFFLLLMMYVAILMIRTKHMTTYLQKKATQYLGGNLFTAQMMFLFLFFLLESASIVAWVIIDEVLLEEFRPTNVPIVTEIWKQCEVSFTAARLVSTFIPCIILIIATFTSFRERHLEHYLYERKFQSFTCIALCIILVAFLPTFKYVVGIYKAIVMAFTMDVFAFTFIACLVLPKVYMAVMRHKHGKEKFPLKPAVAKKKRSVRQKKESNANGSATPNNNSSNASAQNGQGEERAQGASEPNGSRVPQSVSTNPDTTDC